MEHDTPLPLEPEQPISTRRAAYLASELRRLSDLKAEQLQSFNEEITRLQAAADDIADKYDTEMSFRQEELRSWHHALLRDDPKAPKTWTFPGGTSKATEPKPRVVVVDDDAFIGWAQNQGLDDTLVKTTHKVVKAEVTAKFKSRVATVQVDLGCTNPLPGVPGLAVEWPDRTHTFKPAE